MTIARIICCDPQRRAALLAPDAPADISGIDYVEVHAGATTADPTILEVVLVKPLPLPLGRITPDNLRLTGGVRFAPPRASAPVEHDPDAGSVSRWRITLPGDQPTDFSSYRLEIVANPGSTAPPAFLDARLAGVDIDFKLDCPAPGDCLPACPQSDTPAPSSARFDYRTRDYETFRRQILDRMAELVPGFVEDDPVDLTTTLVEALAARADQLSYRLDWVGTEAFLGTARSRAALARHARLMDYTIGEAESARTFAAFTFTPGGAVADGQELPRATPLLPRLPGRDVVIPASEAASILPTVSLVFETAHPLALWSWRNEVAFHTWSDEHCHLPRGACTATLVDGSGAGPGGLAAGDFLILLETRSPTTGARADARPEHRHVVRLTRVSPVSDVLAPATRLVTVEWDAADALPFDLVLQRSRDDAPSSAEARICAVALGNVAFCDHGLSLPPVSLDLTPAQAEALRPALSPPSPLDDQPWRPTLDAGPIARVLAPPMDARDAAAWLDRDAREAVPALTLEDPFAPWHPRTDLLRSDRFDRHFVLETGLSGELQLRFGDGINGLAPDPGHAFAPRGRVGGGARGNIGPGTLTHIALPEALAGMNITVTNPLAATGGREPEAPEDIRINVPRAYRTQERAVTEADYAAAACTHPAVANARARASWTGAWQTIAITLDLAGGRSLDAELKSDIAAHLERVRLIGFDIVLRAARMAPLRLDLHVCAAPGFVRGEVARQVRAALRPAGTHGRAGFFHPDNFSFGEPLYISRLIAFLMALEGVASVEVTRLHRTDRASQGELAQGVLVPGELEILQLNDDPSFPEEGRIGIDMGGGDV